MHIASGTNLIFIPRGNWPISHDQGGERSTLGHVKHYEVIENFDGGACIVVSCS